MSEAGERRTIIEEGTSFRGALAATGPVLARGQIDGEVSGPALEVTETGRVAGQARVRELRSCGELAGRFEAEAVVLSGRVREQTVIVAGALEVVAAVVLEGCELRVGETPSKDQAVRAALAAGHD